MASGLPAVKVPKTEHPCLSRWSSVPSCAMNTSSARTLLFVLWTVCGGKTVKNVVQLLRVHVIASANPEFEGSQTLHNLYSLIDNYILKAAAASFRVTRMFFS